MSDKRGASIGRFRLQHTHTEGRREGGFYSADSAAGISAAQLPGTLREEEPRGSPPSQHGVPRREWPLCPPCPSVSLFFWGGVRSSLGKGLCLQPRPAATSSGAGKVCECLQPGGGTGAPREGNNPPGRVGVARGRGG